MNNFNIIMIVKKTIDQDKAIKKLKMQIKQLKERQIKTQAEIKHTEEASER